MIIEQWYRWYFPSWWYEWMDDESTTPWWYFGELTNIDWSINYSMNWTIVEYCVNWWMMMIWYPLDCGYHINIYIYTYYQWYRDLERLLPGDARCAQSMNSLCDRRHAMVILCLDPRLRWSAEPQHRHHSHI